MIKKIFNKVRKNQMINTSFYTGIGTILNSLSGIFVAKMIAILLGPSGIALISQFQNFISISSAAVTGGIDQGVVKYVAEYRNDEVKFKMFLSTALRYVLTLAIIVGLFIIIFSRYLADYLLQNKEYSFVFVLFGFTVILFGLNRLLLSILNGTGEIKKLVMANIFTSLFAIFITVPLTYFVGLVGALIALSISQSVVFFISLIFVIKSSWFKKEFAKITYHKKYVLDLIKFSLMSASSVILVPFVNIAIRKYIIVNLSIDDAGCWDGLNKISSAYLGIITTTLGYYYLPKLSSLKDKLLIKHEIINGYKIIIPVLCFILVIIYLFKNIIIVILLSPKFISIKDLIFLQLVGDFFKIASFMLSYLMLAKAKTKMFILTQITFLSFLYLTSIIFINIFSLEGVVIAYALNYILYFIAVLFLFRDIIFYKVEE